MEVINNLTAGAVYEKDNKIYNNIYINGINTILCTCGIIYDTT